MFIFISDDSQGNTEIDELLDCPVTSIEEVFGIMSSGQRQRHGNNTVSHI